MRYLLRDLSNLFDLRKLIQSIELGYGWHKLLDSLPSWHI